MLRHVSCLALLVLSVADAFGQAPLDAVSRWRADGEATDSAGENDGTLENETGFAEGIDGEAFDLDGTDQWVTVPSDASLRPGDGSFSASAWFRKSGAFTYPDQATPVMAMADGDFDNGWGVFSGGSVGPNPGCAVDDVTHTVTQAVAAFAVPFDAWAHIACVYDAGGDSLDLFVNGAYEATAVAVEGAIAPSADLYIGRYRRLSIAGRDEFFRGRIDDAQFFLRVLGDEEVASVFLEHRPVVVGDVDCSGVLNASDALKALRHSVGLDAAQTQPCPRLASVFAGVPWGDVDCSDAVIASDALKILRVAIELEIAQDEPCADAGTPPL